MKRSRSGISIMITGILSILLITIVNFNKEDISEYIYMFFNKDDFVFAKKNDYFLENEYKFIQNFDDDVNNKQELINYIYYVINSGSDFANGQCSKNYTDCLSDLEKVSKDAKLLSNLNNYVHPYNNFKIIKFVSNGYGIFSLKIEHIYSKEQIKKINEFADKFISENINSKMTTVEKIKIVHNYIIDETNYDSEINDDSKTAYGVLFNHLGICNGYADTMSILLNHLGIRNYKISNEDHIWNLVYVNGKWLHLDATWDDPISSNEEMRYKYFLINTNTLNSLNDNTHHFDKLVFQEAN